MLAVGSPLTSALAVLNAFTPAQVQPAPVSAERYGGNALTGVSRLSLSSAASDALLRFSTLAAAAQGASTPARASIDVASANTQSASSDPAVSETAESDAAQSSTPKSDIGIPAGRLAWLDSLGADRWELRQPQPIDDAMFEKKVLESLYKTGSAKLAGFADARINGTLEIQRASDMPELGFKSFQVTLYKDDKAYGGVGFSVCDTDHWMALRESGVYAGTGTVAGNDYVATWPMPWGATDNDSDPGTYAAS